MPNYSYRCKSCRKETTVFQKINDAKITRCPSCHKDDLERLIGGMLATFRFEGTGYYITDYGPKKNVRNKDSSNSPCGKK